MSMFRDEAQRLRAVQVLLARWPGRFWDADGPTHEAFEVRDGCSPASGGEKVIVGVAWALWNAEGDTPVSDLLRLDPEMLGSVAGLLAAMSQSAQAVDAWMREQTARAV